jgi:hypothetical protein
MKLQVGVITFCVLLAGLGRELERQSDSFLEKERKHMQDNNG